MKVYDLTADADGHWVRFLTSDDIAIGNYSQQNILFVNNKKIRVQRDDESTPKKSAARLGDFSNVNNAPYACFSGRAKSVLQSHLNGLGQWLELDCNEAPYWLFNITNIVDALDEDRSTVRRFSNGRVMWISKFVMKPSALQQQLIFKIPQRPGSYNLVTDQFVDLVELHGLSGFVFKPLWSLENEVVKSVPVM